MTSVQITVKSGTLGDITADVELPINSWDDEFTRNQIRCLIRDAVAKIHRAYGIGATP